MPSISFIVARSHPDNVIGYKNNLPWHLKSDLRRFREITSGHVVIMGRSTFESIGRALPNRTNIVMSRSRFLANDNGVSFDEGTQLYWSSSLEDTLLVADILSICRQRNDIFVIGGEKMYDLFEKLVNKVFLTEVFAKVQGDAFFKLKFPSPTWKILAKYDVEKGEGDDYRYRFSIKERRNRKDRREFVSRFFTGVVEKNIWLAMQVRKNRTQLEDYVNQNLSLEL